MSETPSPFPLPAPRSSRVEVLVIAGEHSGDEQAARMIATFRRRNPGLAIAAVGGPRLEAAGAQLLFNLTASSVVGFVEVVRHFGFFRRLFAEVLAWIKQHRPRVVCLVDYPGFNLRLARALANAGISHRGGGTVRTVYYISPQIWAWKAHRRFAMARTLDALAVIFPFETKCYADTDLDVRFVGHPFVERDYVSPLRYDRDAPILLLPGSRQAAVRRIFPILRDAFAAFQRAQPDASAIVQYPEEAIKEIVQEQLQGHGDLSRRISLRARGETVTASAVLTSSGTMSLICALAGIPGAIAYRTNPLTYLLAKRWVKIPYIGIANLLLDEPLYPEFVQHEAIAPALTDQLREIAASTARIEQTQKLAVQLRAQLQQTTQGDAASWLSDQLSG